MNGEWLLSFSPIISLMVAVFAQIILSHQSKKIGQSIVFGVLLGLFIQIGLLCLLRKYTPINWQDDCAELLTFFSLCFCFWAFLNLNLTSLRIRLLHELNSGLQLTTENLLQKYSPTELIKRRIDRLKLSGQIKQENNNWILNSRKLLIFVYVSSFLRNVLMVNRGGNGN